MSTHLEKASIDSVFNRGTALLLVGSLMEAASSLRQALPKKEYSCFSASSENQVSGTEKGREKSKI